MSGYASYIASNTLRFGNPFHINARPPLLQIIRASFVAGCVTAYFKESLDEDIDNDTATLGYKCVLNSKAREESLVGYP